MYQAQFNLGISYSNGTIPFTAHRATHQLVLPSCRRHPPTADALPVIRDDIYVLFNPVGLYLTRAQRALVKEVQARWGAFVKTGSPNVAGYRTWRPVGGSDNLNILLLGNGARGNSAVTDVQRTAECAVGSGIYTPA